MNEPTLILYEDVSLPALHVAGLSVRTHPGEAARAIPALWARVLGAGLPGRLPGIAPELPAPDGAGPAPAPPLIAVYHEYESDHRGPYTLTVGVPVAGPVQLPGVPDLRVVALAAQRCAWLGASGERPRAVLGAWTHVWERLTPRRTFHADLEVYRPERGEEGEVVLFVGVR